MPDVIDFRSRLVRRPPTHSVAPKNDRVRWSFDPLARSGFPGPVVQFAGWPVSRWHRWEVWTHTHSDKRKSPVFYRTLSPSGPLPKNPAYVKAWVISPFGAAGQKQKTNFPYSSKTLFSSQIQKWNLSNFSFLFMNDTCLPKSAMNLKYLVAGKIFYSSVQLIWKSDKN